jgi:hypothetical protein
MKSISPSLDDADRLQSDDCGVRFSMPQRPRSPAPRPSPPQTFRAPSTWKLAIRTNRSPRTSSTGLERGPSLALKCDRIDGNNFTPSIASSEHYSRADSPEQIAVCSLSAVSKRNHAVKVKHRNWQRRRYYSSNLPLCPEPMLLCRLASDGSDWEEMRNVGYHGVELRVGRRVHCHWSGRVLRVAETNARGCSVFARANPDTIEIDMLTGWQR